jgi:hypothetical protein
MLDRKKDTVIFDMDGTLANIERRRKFAAYSDGNLCWKTFFHWYNVKVLDEPNEPVMLHFKMLRDWGYRIFVFSARIENLRYETMEFLLKNDCKPDMMVLKADDDTRPDDIVKKEWLDKYFPGEEKDRILCVYDDRDKVVNMWRKNGVTCFQVNEGNF